MNMLGKKRNLEINIENNKEAVKLNSDKIKIESIKKYKEK